MEIILTEYFFRIASQCCNIYSTNFEVESDEGEEDNHDNVRHENGNLP